MGTHITQTGYPHAGAAASGAAGGRVLPQATRQIEPSMLLLAAPAHEHEDAARDREHEDRAAAEQP